MESAWSFLEGNPAHPDHHLLYPVSGCPHGDSCNVRGALCHARSPFHPAWSVAALVWVAASNHLPVDRIRASLMDQGSISILLLIVAIMIFQGVLKESQAALQIRSELFAYRIPVSMVIMILPFLAGFITGIAVGFVGTSFPSSSPCFRRIVLWVTCPPQPWRSLRVHGNDAFAGPSLFPRHKRLLRGKPHQKLP
ncbi:MAG: DUF401 family protein, partial [Desulfobacteraceae bacterium]